MPFFFCQDFAGFVRFAETQGNVFFSFQFLEVAVSPLQDSHADTGSASVHAAKCGQFPGLVGFLWGNPPRHACKVCLLASSWAAAYVADREGGIVDVYKGP